MTSQGGNYFASLDSLATAIFVKPPPAFLFSTCCTFSLVQRFPTQTSATSSGSHLFLFAVVIYPLLETVLSLITTCKLQKTSVLVRAP